jgi:hypothetical protein
VSGNGAVLQEFVLPNEERSLRERGCLPERSDTSMSQMENHNEVELEQLSGGNFDAGMLERFGRILDKRPANLNGCSVGMMLAEWLLRVRRRDGTAVPLIPNAAQRAFEERRGTRNIVLKARQVGMTTWSAARFFLKTITRPGTMTVQVAHTQEAAEEIFRIVHRFVDYLPRELRQGPLLTSRANASQLVFPLLDSQYRVVTAGDRNAGRGLTVQNLHCSELARWPGDPAETLAGLRAAMAPGSELIIESTPEGIGDCFHEEWEKADETGMVRHFFPWWMEAAYRSDAVEESSLTDEELELRSKHGLDLKQIGFRRAIRANFRGLARQEYAEDEESCFKTSGDSVFELEALEARLITAPQPVQRRRNGELEVWLPSVPGRQYVVAVDPAGGGSNGDYSAIEVLDMATGIQCAEFAGHIGGLELARLVVEIANEYQRAWVVVERNNHGSGVLAHLESSCAYDRLYRLGGQAGWLTTSLSRPAVLGKLDAALVEDPRKFMSKRLLSECRSFVRLPGGRTGARAGAHDDRVMAMAIGLAARAELLMGKGNC